MAKNLVSDSTLPVLTGSERRAARFDWNFELVFPVAETRRFRIAPTRSLVLGRDSGVDVVLASHQVSRRHAELARVGGDLWVHDFSSLNGTHVNGERVVRRALSPGDVIRIGDRLGVVVRDRIDEHESSAVTQIASELWAGPALRSALSAAQKVAKTNLPVLVEGPTGSGKERVARAIHEWSGRAGAFVALNCAAIPEHLAEAELFGYRKGAFTGAGNAAFGHFRAAHGGTLLLDEVSDLPLGLQAKLLRVVEQNEVQPLGEARAQPIDVRLVVASQRPLRDEVDAGRFRADLHARFNGVTVSLPALSRRKSDIPSLFQRLLDKHLQAPPPPADVLLIERLLVYGWPGNVRELELLSRRLLGLHGHEERLWLSHLAGTALESPRDDALESAEPAEDSPHLSRDERDVRALLSALRRSNGNLTEAAALARVSRQRAYRLLQSQAAVDLKALRKGSLA